MLKYANNDCTFAGNYDILAYSCSTELVRSGRVGFPFDFKVGPDHGDQTEPRDYSRLTGSRCLSDQSHPEESRGTESADRTLPTSICSVCSCVSSVIKLVDQPSYSLLDPQKQWRSVIFTAIQTGRTAGELSNISGGRYRWRCVTLISCIGH